MLLGMAMVDPNPQRGRQKKRIEPDDHPTPQRKGETEKHHRDHLKHQQGLNNSPKHLEVVVVVVVVVVTSSPLQPSALFGLVCF